MLDALLCLDLGIDFGSRSSYENVSLVINFGEVLGSPPAAAAGSRPDFAASVAGLSEPLGRGLLLRLDSDLEGGGERDRLSNLEGRAGSF